MKLTAQSEKLRNSENTALVVRRTVKPQGPAVKSIAGQSSADTYTPTPLPSTMIGSESGDPWSPTGGLSSGPVPPSVTPVSFGKVDP